MKKTLVFLLAVLFSSLISCAPAHKDIKQEEAVAVPSPAKKSSGESGSAVSLMEAIEQSAEQIARSLPRGSRVAVVAFESESGNLSDFIMNEFTGAGVVRQAEAAV